VADGVISHSQALNQNDTTEFRLRVTQSDLGPVNIQLISTGDEVRGHVVVASDSARQLLESQLPELRQKLESAGLSVQNFSVSTDSSGSGTSSGSAWQNQTSGTPSPYQAPVSTSASTAASRFRSSAISNGSQVDVVV
jgi:flagellar hook-length control protein FliK